MQPSNFLKAFLFAIMIVAAFLVFWESFWRNKGYETGFDDGKELWADKRAMVYEPADKATVFIGSSRIKFDLDIDTWEKLTGEKAIQLAMVGSSPRLALLDLAEDENFKGKLIIDVTEILFFNLAPPYDKSPKENISFYKKRTPSEKFSFQVGQRLESNLVFLNEEFFSINGLLADVPLPPRKDVFVFPVFPADFDVVSFKRQSYMTDAFVKDTNKHKWVQNVWITLGEAAKKFPPQKEEATESIFTTVKDAVEKIKSRGGQVMFVRTPASGPMGEGEQMMFPREAFWNKLLAVTNTDGIHYLDYPETSNFICPEWSHLAPADAVIYTTHFVKQLEQKGWRFNSASTANPSLTAKK